MNDKARVHKWNKRQKYMKLKYGLEGGSVLSFIDFCGKYLACTRKVDKRRKSMQVHNVKSRKIIYDAPLDTKMKSDMAVSIFEEWVRNVENNGSLIVLF